MREFKSSSPGHQAPVITLPAKPDISSGVTSYDPELNSTKLVGYETGAAIIPITPPHVKPSDTSLWSWDESIKHKINKLEVNKGIAAWMDYDASFANWVKSCVAMHVENDYDETVCPVPDRWRGEIGGSITVIKADCIPGKRNRHGGQDIGTVVDGVYHVMQGPV